MLVLTREGKRTRRREYTNWGFFHLSNDFLWHVLITLCNPCSPQRLREQVSSYPLSQRMEADVRLRRRRKSRRIEEGLIVS